VLFIVLLLEFHKSIYQYGGYSAQVKESENRDALNNSGKHRAAKMKSANALSIDMTMPLEITELYEQHYAVVYRTALKITGNEADAEDALCRRPHLIAPCGRHSFQGAVG
jgi:hypothetical protein